MTPFRKTLLALAIAIVVGLFALAVAAILPGAIVLLAAAYGIYELSLDVILITVRFVKRWLKDRAKTPV